MFFYFDLYHRLMNLIMSNNKKSYECILYFVDFVLYFVFTVIYHNVIIIKTKFNIHNDLMTNVFKIYYY